MERVRGEGSPWHRARHDLHVRRAWATRLRRDRQRSNQLDVGSCLTGESRPAIRRAALQPKPAGLGPLVPATRTRVYPARREHDIRPPTAPQHPARHVRCRSATRQRARLAKRLCRVRIALASCRSGRRRREPVSQGRNRRTEFASEGVPSEARKGASAVPQSQFEEPSFGRDGDSTFAALQRMLCGTGRVI